MRISFLVEGMPKAFGANMDVIVGLDYRLVRTLWIVSYAVTAGLESGTLSLNLMITF